MARKKHDWPQVWKSLGMITLVSMLSVALFGLLCWALTLHSFQLSLKVAVEIFWIITTEVLLSRYIRIVQKDFPRRVVHFALVVALASGLLGAEDYVHRRVSPFHDCDSIVKESLGDAEFIHSSLLTEVDTSMVGYYIFPTVHQHYQHGTSDVTFEAYVAAPVKQSKGVYLIYRVSGEERDYTFASDEKLNDYYHEFCKISHDLILPLIVKSFEKSICTLWTRYCQDYGPSALVESLAKMYDYIKVRDLDGALQWASEDLDRSISGDRPVYRPGKTQD